MRVFYPAEMCKVRLIESKKKLWKTIEFLERFGGAEIRKFSHSEVGNAKALEGLQATSEKLVKAEALLATLPEHAGKAALSGKEAGEFLSSREFREVEEKISAVQSEMEGIREKVEILKEEKAQARKFYQFNIDFSDLETETLDIVAGIVRNENRKVFEKALQSRAVLRNMAKDAGTKGTMLLVAIRKGDEAALQGLVKAGLERMPVPKIPGVPSREVEKAEASEERLKRRLESLEKELAKISKAHGAKLAGAAEYLRIEAEKSSVPANFGNTEHTVIIEAYLPEKNYDAFESLLRKEFGNDVFVRKFSAEHLAKHHEETPTLLEHREILAPFEFMTRFVSLPKSNEIDPTLIFLVFFPLLYAMMVGDVVYGILSFFIAFWLSKKFAPGGIMNPVAKIWMWSAVPTVLFGVVYDEYAGMPHTELLQKLGFGTVQLYKGIDRIHDVRFLLLVCILLGIALMGLGFLLGFVNARKHGNNSHAIAKLGWFAVLCSGTILVSSALFKVLPQVYALPSALVFVAGLGGVVKGEGVMGLMELPSLLSNVLSFARVIAVGLVGTVIALILNSMAYPAADKGLMLVLLIPLYAFGHLFNAGMAMFESFIQGARLNYVEFYSKFFEGGGKEFAPFRFERRYLKD